MKSLVIILCWLSLLSASAKAQSPYQQILSAVGSQSPRLQALHKECQAQQEEARQESVLADPEVSFAYLWGDPHSIGQRWDLSVSQPFDFPTTYLHRKAVKRLAIQSASLRYEVACREVLLQGQQLCVELTYNDTLLSLIAHQQSLLSRLVDAERLRLEEGAATVLAYNQAEQEWMQSRNEMHELQSQCEAQRLELLALAGVEELPISQLTLADLPQLPAISQFEDWWSGVVETSPLMRYVHNEVARSQEQVRLSKDGWLPGFSVGYMSENTKAESFRGLTMSISLPVWNNRHKVKSSQLRNEAAQLDAQSQKMQFLARLKGLYVKATEYQRQASDLRQMIERQQTQALLDRQFGEGVINLCDYLSGTIEQLELQKSLLSAERELQLLWTELHSVE